MLRLENVTKIFNRGLNPEDVKIALNDISIDIEDGEFVTIIGSNGSGKSTFLNVINGIHLVDKGKILIDNIDVTKMGDYKRSKYIGVVFQDPMQGTSANMSILENLLIASRRTRASTLSWGFSKEKEKSFAAMLSRFNLGLEDRLNQRMGQLSGGQRQAVTLLMATLESPKLLLLDEHTAALDPKTAKTVLELTDTIVKENQLTTIMITHNMRDAIKYGNRLLMFNDGKIVYDVKGEEKKKLTIEDLLKKFDANNAVISDEMLLAK